MAGKTNYTVHTGTQIGKKKICAHEKSVVESYTVIHSFALLYQLHFCFLSFRLPRGTLVNCSAPSPNKMLVIIFPFPQGMVRFGAQCLGPQLDAVSTSSKYPYLSFSLSLRAPQDLATSDPETDLCPEGWGHCESADPIPGDHHQAHSMCAAKTWVLIWK